MKIDELIGPFVFMGDERIAAAIYEHMRPNLTLLEQFVLLHYLEIPIHDDAKRAFRAADVPAREAARRSMMAKLPKEWPPP